MVTNTHSSASIMRSTHLSGSSAPLNSTGCLSAGHVIMGKTTFNELPGGRSRLVHQSVFFSIADRDGMVASGMERRRA